MAVTRSTPADRRGPSGNRPPAAPGPLLLSARPRRQETAFLAAALVLFFLGLSLLYATLRAPLAATAGRLASGELIDLRRAGSPEALLPLLGFVADRGERAFVASRIASDLAAPGGALDNVGELGRIRVEAADVSAERTPGLAARLIPERGSVALLSASDLQALKGRLVVRTPDEFRSLLLRWALFLALGFVAVHLIWRLRGFGGDEFLLPAAAVLCGLGFLVMVSVRDPVRDLALFRTFGQGVVAGCALLLAASLLDVRKLERSAVARFWIAPLGAALGLSVLLILFGRGPGGSDAKVNLLGFQPVEAIKLLVVLFLAGYFLERWEFLREVADRRPGLAGLSRWTRIPKLEYALPPLVAIALVLFFFFLQRDLGPALVLAFLFFILYSVARGRPTVAIVGALLVALAFFGGYKIGYPHTVTRRIAMWVSPWDNSFRGGDHLAQSLWAMAEGAGTGTGLGLGEPERVPEVHTDTVLAAVGEELGFVGLLAVFALYVLIAARGFRAALRSGGAYGLFLGLGLTLLLVLNVVLIGGGVVGVLPLSGVVSPFLSSGRSAMLANFLVLGFLAALSGRPGDPQANRQFAGGVRWVGLLLLVPLAAIVGRLAWVQLVRADDVLTRGALTLQADGVRRFVYDPRLAAIAATIPRGSIVDRNGLPLATSDLGELARYQTALRQLGAQALPDLSAVTPAGSPGGRDRGVTFTPRTYPLGGRTFHLLGDLRNRVNWAASNTSYAERDGRIRLQGYDDYAAVVQAPQPDGSVVPLVKVDYRELVPLLRHKNQPAHPEVRRLLDRDRTLRLTVDARLQVKVGEILERYARQAGLGDGAAAVVIDATTGDLLASVGYPWPARLPVESSADPAAGVIDRARYGIYPPGSTFKLVTAMAALRKDAGVAEKTFECHPLPGGRVGNHVRGWGKAIRDDPTVTSPHGTVDLVTGIRQSCNAYFAQLAVYEVGPGPLLETASLLGIRTARPNTPEQLKKALPQSAYGQGQVIATPLQMARVAATVAAGGLAPEVRWILSERKVPAGSAAAPPPATAAAGTEPAAPAAESADPAASTAPQTIVSPEAAALLGGAMRGVVTTGTAARFLAGVVPPIAGKTGTAEVQGRASHSWFIGFAPYGAAHGANRRKIAVAVIVEHGGYGGRLAAPAAGEIVRAAAGLGLIESPIE